MEIEKETLHSSTIGQARYPHLFSPFQLGRLRLANRMMVPAMTTNFAERDGTVGDSLIDYLSERARGGFGSIVTENIGVDVTGRVMPRMVMAYDDRFLPGLERLARAIHEAGGVVIGQISHAGRQTRSSVTGHQLVAPSAIPCPLNKEVPRALTVDEIEQLERAFVAAAQRLARAGFDGIEIHGAHGYLVGGFLSGYSNHRTDRYGGSIENRSRFLMNIVTGIRVALGRDFPLLVRISADEFVEGGLDVPQAIAIARRLESENVDALSVSVGVYESFNRLSMITGEPEGQWLSLAAEVKKGTRLPIIGVGRIKRARVAEAALQTGQIDLAAFGRAAIADPALPAKTLSGAEEDILPCFGCNVCLGRSSRPETICPLNPGVGRERAAHFQPATKALRLAIHGSSFCAMTAAWAAASRGHRVEIVTGDEPLGGMQAWRARVPTQAEYAEVIASLARRACRAGARLVREAGPADETWRLRSFQPVDRALLATIPNSISCYDVLHGRAAPRWARRITVIGHDLASAEAAILAAMAGADVMLLSPRSQIAIDAHPGYREISQRTLRNLGVEVRFGHSADATDMGLGADLVVVGHDAKTDAHSAAHWLAPDLPASGWLSDYYEPDLMTKGIYAAFDLAMSLGT